MNTYDTETRALTPDELGMVAGGHEPYADFNFGGVRFKFEPDNIVKVTWWDGRESWRGWTPKP